MLLLFAPSTSPFPKKDQISPEFLVFNFSTRLE